MFERTSKLPAILAILVLLAVAVAILHYTGYLTVYEDGAFRLLTLTGCLPGGICN